MEPSTSGRVMTDEDVEKQGLLLEHRGSGSKTLRAAVSQAPREVSAGHRQGGCTAGLRMTLTLLSGTAHAGLLHHCAQLVQPEVWDRMVSAGCTTPAAVSYPVPATTMTCVPPPRLQRHPATHRHHLLHHLQLPQAV
jgi:hypothetical protein